MVIIKNYHKIFFISFSLFISDSNKKNVEVVEKFNVNFKCSKFSTEEGKEKLIKKIKDWLDKLKVVYSDNTLYNILIPNGNKVVSKIKIFYN